MLSALIPDNLETEADFDRAYWRVALPAGGVCMGAVGLVELWHAFGVLGVLGAAGAVAIGFATRSNGMLKAPNPIEVSYEVPKQEAIRLAGANFAYAEVLRQVLAKRAAAPPRSSPINGPTVYRPNAIACPYPEHGEGCRVVYDAQRHQVFHHYDGKIDAEYITSSSEIKIRDPRMSVRIFG